MTTFFQKNKVFILGAIASILTVLQQFFQTNDHPDYKVVGFAALAALASYFAKNLTGQAASIAGIVGSLVATISVQASSGSISWAQIILQVISGALLVFTQVSFQPATKLSK